jgi:hypothetical protein
VKAGRDLSFIEAMLERLFRLTQQDRNNAAKEFEKVLREPGFKSLVESLAQKTPTSREPLTQRLTQLLAEPYFEEIVESLSKVQDEVHPNNPTQVRRSKIDVLQRILLYTNSAKNLDRFRQDGKTLLITLQKGYLIHVNFSGLGTEAKGDHPAIIWETKPQRDHVVVIPCTSYKPNSTIETEQQFNIGQVKFIGANQVVNGVLQPQTVVQLDQMQPVSRKRIRTHKTFNPTSRQLEIAKIDEQQQIRIEEGLRIYQLGENSLYKAEIIDYINMIPYFPNHDIQFNHLHRKYVIQSSAPEKVVYKVEGDANKYEIIRKPSNITERERLNYLYDWIHAKGDGQNTAAVRRSDMHRLMQGCVQQINQVP